MSGQAKQKPPPVVCYEEPAQQPVQMTTGQANESNDFRARRLGLKTEPEAERPGPGDLYGATVDQVGNAQLPVDVADLRPGGATSGPAIGYGDADAPAVGSGMSGASDFVGTINDGMTLVDGVQKLGSRDGLEKAEGAAEVVSSGTSLTSTILPYVAPEAAAAAGVAGAASAGMAAAAVAHEGGDHHIRERKVLGGDSASDWASKGDSLGEVAKRSVQGAALEVASAPAGIADASSQKIAEAVLTYSGEDGPKSDRAHPPRNPEESAMAKEAGKRTYSPEAWAGKPSMWNMLTNSEDEASSGIISTDSGTYVENYTHPDNGPWIDPQIAIRAEKARQEECERQKNSGQVYEQTSYGVNGEVTGGASVAPGGDAPGTGYCEAKE